jgi:hypothetical protein
MGADTKPNPRRPQERHTVALQQWVTESKLAQPRNVWVTPHEQRWIRVPQSPPLRYLMTRLVDHASKIEEEEVDWSALVRSTENLPRELGIDIDAKTLLVLREAGFITAVQITPDCRLWDLSSIHRHLTDASDPDFWTPARVHRYNQISKPRKKSKP